MLLRFGGDNIVVRLREIACLSVYFSGDNCLDGKAFIIF